MAISFSLTKFDKVRIAFEVVMFDKLAKSSRARYMLRVAPSSSSPCVSLRNKSDSASRPLMCFWVSDTVRSSDMPKSIESCLMKY